MSFLDNAFRDWICETIRTEIQALATNIIEQVVAATTVQKQGLPTYVTPKQVAEILPVTADTVRSWTRNGKLQGYKPGGKLCVRWDEVQAFMLRTNDAPTPDDDDARVREILGSAKPIKLVR